MAHERTVSPTRRRVYTALAFLLPALFFVLTEVALRMVGYGDDYPLFVGVPAHDDYLIPSPDVGRRYFTRSSLVPSPPHDAFLREKPGNGIRVFVQGGSTGAGFPYGHGGMFSRMIRQRLIRTFPERHVEVVNTSMAAVNSYTLLDLSTEILEQSPDAVLVYAGHNEFYGAMGVASVESPGASRILVRLVLTLDRFRVVQGVRSLLEAIRRVIQPADGNRAEGATLMEEMAGNASIDRDDELFTLGVKQFRGNLSELLCRYAEAGVPAYIGTLVANERDQEPLQSGLRAETDEQEWIEQREAANRLLSQGDTLGALWELEDLIELDSTSADAWYERARLLDMMGRLAKARFDYREAKNLDRLRFRGPEDMNIVIRDVAKKCGATLVDVEEAFAATSPGGIVGHELLFEHVHPNLDGYLLMANTYYDALHRGGLAETWPTPLPGKLHRRDALVTKLDSTLASWHIRRLLNNWPFQERGTTRTDTLRISTIVDSLALDVLRGRKTWVEATAELGRHHESQGDFQSTLRAALALAEEQPYRSSPFLMAANQFVRLGRFAAALQYYAAADEREPSLEARRAAGLLLVRAGRFPEAISWLERAVHLDPNDRIVLYHLGVANAASGHDEEALNLAKRLVELEPESAAARQLLDRIQNSADL